MNRGARPRLLTYKSTQRVPCNPSLQFTVGVISGGIPRKIFIAKQCSFGTRWTSKQTTCIRANTKVAYRHVCHVTDSPKPSPSRLSVQVEFFSIFTTLTERKPYWWLSTSHSLQRFVRMWRHFLGRNSCSPLIQQTVLITASTKATSFCLVNILWYTTTDNSYSEL